MGSRDGEMEKGLLCEGGDEEEEEEEEVLYSASFLAAEDGFIKLKTTQWILYSLSLMLAWGLGVAMLLYLPLRRYILRTMIRSRNLYIAPDAIVYKVTQPAPFPCFGVLKKKKEKHVLLASVADVVIEQGYLQSRYGVYSIRIENVGVRRPPSDDVQIKGVTNPQAFRKDVLTRLSDMRSQALACILEDAAASENFQSSMANAGEFAILQKLDEVGNSLKRVQSLIEERQPKTSH